ncbi:hypothetical protein KKD03_03430 [Patescibacteria group bacterium]|nr:hypothetical protein [Patescibacteria group bacterium]
MAVFYLESYGLMVSREDILCWLNKLIVDPRSAIYYVIRLEKNIVGHIGLRDMSLENSSAEMGIVNLLRKTFLFKEICDTDSGVDLQYSLLR